MDKISVDLWFDDNAEEAVNFYVSVFNNSRVLRTLDYVENTPGPEGTVMYIEFELEGKRFGAVNGGPHFKFSPAISLVVNCESQDELDSYWNKLSAVPEAEQCGWLQDKFGVSWQIVPVQLGELLHDNDPERAKRATYAMLEMKKLDIEALEKAAAG